MDQGSPPSADAVLRRSQEVIEATNTIAQTTTVTEKKVDDPALVEKNTQDVHIPLLKSNKVGQDTTHETKKAKIPMLKLWKYADSREKLYICIAIFFSAGTGVLVPAVILIMGQILGVTNTSSSGGLNLFNASPKQIKTVLDAAGIDLMDSFGPQILKFVYFGIALFVAAYISTAMWTWSAETQGKRIRELYVQSILNQDMGWHDGQQTSLNTRLAIDTANITEGLGEKTGMIIESLCSGLTGLIIALVKSWKLALVMLACFPLMGAAGVTMLLALKKATTKSQSVYASAGAIAEQALAAIRTVSAFSLQARFTKRYDEKLSEAFDADCAKGTTIGFGVGTFFFVLFSTYGLAYWYASTLVISGELEPQNVLVVFFSMMIGTFALIMIPSSLSTVAAAQSSAYEVYAVIDRVPVINARSTTGLKPETSHGKIEFKNVKFNYPSRSDVPILRCLNAEVDGGNTIAFVGPSGSGKSTSISLVQRFYDPADGEVLIDGINIKEYNLEWLRQQIGVVGQEPVLFNLTVKQNILMGCTKAIPEARLIEACQMANCHNFILNLPNGYDTLVGQSGGMMSGGQKQRIAIARALVKNPKILLLDEATSALDTASERLVQKALDVASKSRTTIVIAHRLSTIRNADTIVVMDKGNLVEQGNHNTLLQLGGVYFQLVEKQKIVKSTEIDEEKAEQAARAIETAEKNNKIVPNSTEVVTTSVNMNPDALIEIEDAASLTKLANARRKQERIEEALKVKSNSVAMSRVIQLMRPSWGLLAIGIFASGIAGAAFPGYAVTLAKVVILFLSSSGLSTSAKQTLIAPSALEGANLYCFIFAMIGIGAFVGTSVARAAFARAGAHLTRLLRRELFSAFLRQEVGFFDLPGNGLGVLSSRLATDAANVTVMISEAWGEAAQLVSTCVTGLVIAFYYGPAITGILLLMLPGMAYGGYTRSRSMKGFEDQTKKAYEESSEVAAEAIRDVRTVASLTRQKYFLEKYSAALDDPHHMGKVKAYRDSLGGAVQKSFMQFTNAVGFYAGIRLIMGGHISFEDMFIAIICTMITTQQLGNSATFISNLSKGKTAAANIFLYVDRKSAIEPDAPGISNDTFDPNFEFKDVAFEYPARPDQKIFKGMFNLKGTQNQTIALVGPSGCGKSTTIGMLERWYDASAGVVSVGGINTKDYQLKTGLRKHIALVGQEPVLFDMSIRENIAWGVDGEATDAQIQEVAEFANIHKFIDDLPDKYSTRVGDKGGQLSGGQKQRIAIARALIRKPKMLLLDEATSALDSESEKIVQVAIDKAAKGRTTVTIAHRLSTIQHADVIAVVSDGVIKEIGKHQELLALHGIYSGLVKQQDLSMLQ